MMLADAARLEQSGKLYIHGGGWNQIWAQSFPTIHLTMTVVVILYLDRSESDDGMGLGLSLVGDQDDTLIEITGTLNAKRPPDLDERLPTTGFVVLPMPPVEFARPGVYQFVLTAKEKEIGSLPFSVQPRDT